MASVDLGRPQQSPLRQHWGLDPRVVFLNHGSFGACPTLVLQHQDALQREMEADPVKFLWRDYDSRLQVARSGLAEFLGAQVDDLVFVTNATTAVNAVVRSWPLRRGDEIITTSLDYNACRNVLLEVSARSGAKVVVVPIPFPLESSDVVLDAILAAVTPRTRFAMIDHVTSGSAMRLAAEHIASELENRGVATLIDGAHAPGMFETDFRKLRASWYTGNLHKWVCAPKGAAFLWVRKDVQLEIHPAVTSHGPNTPRGGFPAWQDRFDWAGTFDATAWMSVPMAVEVIAGLQPGGWPEVRAHNRGLVLAAREMLCEVLDLSPPCPVAMIGSMATLPLPERFQQVRQSSRIAPEALRLDEDFGIQVPIVTIDGLRCFRVSAHLHNHLDEYAFLAESIKLI